MSIIELSDEDKSRQLSDSEDEFGSFLKSLVRNQTQITRQSRQPSVEFSDSAVTEILSSSDEDDEPPPPPPPPLPPILPTAGSLTVLWDPQILALPTLKQPTENALLDAVRESGHLCLKHTLGGPFIKWEIKDVGMVVMEADLLVSLIDQDRLLRRLEIWRASLSVGRLFVVVLGLQRYWKRGADKENREFSRQIREYMKKGTTNAGSSVGTMAEEDVEQKILELQMTQPWISWFCWQCQSAAELSKLLRQITADLAIPPKPPLKSTTYITQEIAEALRASVIRSGTDHRDTWIQALCQLPKVTMPVAEAIAQKYPTPQCLFKGWRQLGTQSERERMLASLYINRQTKRPLGNNLSQRIYRILTYTGDMDTPYMEII